MSSKSAIFHLLYAESRTAITRGYGKGSQGNYYLMGINFSFG